MDMSRKSVWQTVHHASPTAWVTKEEKGRDSLAQNRTCKSQDIQWLSNASACAAASVEIVT